DSNTESAGWLALPLAQRLCDSFPRDARGQPVRASNRDGRHSTVTAEGCIWGGDAMASGLRLLAAVTVVAGLAAAGPALAQKSGGILKVYHRDSPGSMSILEEATNSTEIPMMGVMNNLVLYKQDVPQNSMETIVSDLATSWSWSEDGKELTFALRQGVSWHDGKPFTARDVHCTWELLLDKGDAKLRANPRKAWYQNVEEVTAKGNYEATFYLKRPQPGLITLLASGYAPIYPCHVTPQQMRQQPIGTGPFKFGEFKPN